LIKDGQLTTQDTIQSERIQICSFLWVYTTFPNAIIRGIPASQVRKRLGACLARQDIESGLIPDIISPVPDSGRFHAIGYFQEFLRQFAEGKIEKIPFYDEVLLKYPYARRSYIPQEELARIQEGKIKILSGGETFQDLILVVVDDSLVRGTQTKADLVPKVRSLGFKEIHLRLSNPELLSHCRWGKTTKKGETLASQMPSMEERVRHLGIDSLKYNDISNLVEAIGFSRERLCVDCDFPSQ
jgi:amidophosphoribosyltransferase